jgi:hypothetical protein
VYSPRWTADGTHLVFSRAGYLWVVDADGGTPVPVAGPIDSLRDRSFGDTPIELFPYELPGDPVWDVNDLRP